MRRKNWTLNERIAANVVVDSNGCWIWQLRINPRNGYGYLSITGDPRFGRVAAAHRVSYVVHVGPVPDGKELDHLCRVRACCNPAHLEPVTRLTNVRRGEGSGGSLAPTRTHCPNGHEAGAGRCRECARARGRAYVARKRQQAQAAA